MIIVCACVMSSSCGKMGDLFLGESDPTSETTVQGNNNTVVVGEQNSTTTSDIDTVPVATK